MLKYFELGTLMILALCETFSLLISFKRIFLTIFGLVYDFEGFNIYLKSI